MLSFVSILIVLFSIICFGNSFSLKMANSFYDITEKGADGKDIAFSNFRGKVVYGVNVASKCGYTASGYALLSKIAKLKAEGKPVEVLVFPCNQFGAQEPGTDQEVANFCALKGVPNATVLTKADVNGPQTRPTYKFLKEKKIFGDIAWNFAGKFIIDKDGNPLPVKSDGEVEKLVTDLAK